jgi:hypothetical protein
MSEPKHTYPDRHPPGTDWATDEAWGILDRIKPGIIPDDVRAYLAGAIAALLVKAMKNGNNPPIWH